MCEHSIPTKCLAAFWTVLLSNLMRKVYSCSWKNQVYHHPVVPLEDRLSLVLDQESVVAIDARCRGH